MLKKGDKVSHIYLPFSQTGIGIIKSISKQSKKIWVNWEKLSSSLEPPERLRKLQEPAILLKEIL